MIDLECATETRNCFEARELGCRVVAVFLLFLFPFLSKTKKSAQKLVSDFTAWLETLLYASKPVIVHTSQTPTAKAASLLRKLAFSR